MWVECGKGRRSESPEGPGQLRAVSRVVMSVRGGRDEQEWEEKEAGACGLLVGRRAASGECDCGRGGEGLPGGGGRRRARQEASHVPAA